MATIDSVNAAGTISPVVTSRTGNTADNVRAFQLLRDLANTRTLDFQQQFALNDDAPSAFSDSDLLNLSSQSLDILNGVAPTTEETLNLITQTNLTQQVAAQQAAVQTQIAANNVLNLTTVQRENLASIINEFANAPFNQNTFLQIQNSLVAARINPQLISLQTILQEVFGGGTTSSTANRRLRDQSTYASEAA